MSTTEVEPKAPKALPIAKLAKQFNELAKAIPTDSGTATERILQQLLDAESLDKLNDPWDTEDTEKILGKMMLITGLKRQPSTFPTGLGFFLVVDSAMIETGETVTWTTGSLSVVAQLVKAYSLTGLPIRCELHQSATPSQNGYYPQHLTIYGADF